MDYTELNNKDRAFFEQDFYPIWELMKRIRSSLVNRTSIISRDINLHNVLDFVPNSTQIYITLFQAGLKPIRWGSCRDTLDGTLNRIVNKITSLPVFKEFNVAKSDECRIMIEYVIERTPVKLADIKYATFSPARFEPGVTGFELILDRNRNYYMPTDAWINSHIVVKSALNTLLRRTYIKDLTNKMSERIDILSNTPHEINIIKSRAFITYEERVFPLYRGNILYNYSTDKIKDMALDGADWILKYQTDDGKFLYYYDAKEDNYIDHEHPDRESDNLYYNDLRHCGGIVTLIRAYQLTKDEKYLAGAKKGLDFIASLTVEHDYNGKPAGFIYYNDKGKLGGVGMALIAMMKYRNETGDKSYDDYIKKYTRHLLSRIYKTGEFLGYYVHPSFNNGLPLIEMSDEERRATFSFYYPGEALLGLALYANYFDEDDELKQDVLEKSKLALDWIVDERPKIYSDLFTELPSDAWLMQAIEEWANNPDFRKQNYLNFVFSDAQTMINKMYTANNSPYIDYEGGFYYNYGDHFYPDGSRSEGLIAAYYLAKKLGDEQRAKEILNACKLTAKSQMLLCNNEYNSYAHKNPQKSEGAIRFKVTRQWVRVDSIQHVACFYLRLYFAEKGIVAR